jgi:YesN/AraC family two-component response regulator
MRKEMKKINPEQQIIISGHKESDFLFDLLDIGIDVYIMKPIDITVLLKTLWDTTKQISAMRHRCHLDELLLR